jgi:hypothetical protein
VPRPPRATPFDPDFLERSPLFWPVAPAARSLLARASRDRTGDGTAPDFPPVQSLDRVFGDEAHEAPVRFVPAAPRPRRGRRKPTVDVCALYDARITLDRVVPTRARSWHDLMNALVWGTFPLAKRALHARQHRAIAERLAPGARTLPPARTRELDALALLDEGGVVLLGSDPEGTIVFGHAIYESLALGIPPTVVAAIALDAPERTLGAVDAALARHIEDGERLRSPEELTRVALPTPSTGMGAWATHGAPKAP